MDRKDKEIFESIVINLKDLGLDSDEILSCLMYIEKFIEYKG